MVVSVELSDLMINKFNIFKLVMKCLVHKSLRSLLSRRNLFWILQR